MANRLTLLLFSLSLQSALGQQWNEPVIVCSTDDDAWTSIPATMGGGVIIGIIALVLASLVVCCSACKAQKGIIGWVAGILGLVTIILPAVGGIIACQGAGVVIAYTLGLGFIPLVIGTIALILGCCICCKCGGAKDDFPAQVVVVGSPA